MSGHGSNLPDFRSAQLDFAAHIRNPRVHPRPADVEPRRMQIYLDLFFNNIKSFLDSAFPLSRQILGDDKWLRLVREFIHTHPSESPYFLQISEEFLTFLDARGLHELPPFLLELCHYEWVELALDVAVQEVEPEAYLPDGELLGDLVISPLVRALSYRFAVHEIGMANQPLAAPANPTHLLVYRDAECNVRFIESNALTHRLLALVATMSARDAFAVIHNELAESGHDISESKVHAQGIQTLTKLRRAGIILGGRNHGVDA